MLPTPPTMRMLDNYRMTGSMMNNSWRYEQNKPPRPFVIKPLAPVLPVRGFEPLGRFPDDRSRIY